MNQTIHQRNALAESGNHEQRSQAAWDAAIAGLTSDQRANLAFWVLGYIQSDVPVDRWEQAVAQGRAFVAPEAVSA